MKTLNFETMITITKISCQVWDSNPRTLGVPELKSDALDHSANLT